MDDLRQCKQCERWLDKETNFYKNSTNKIGTKQYWSRTCKRCKSKNTEHQNKFDDMTIEEGKEYLKGKINDLKIYY